MDRTKLKRIAIIGGGASGLIAACFAAGKNREVVIFEKQKKIGRKILVTGNGRCNISNRNISARNYHGRNPDFVRNIFARFGLDETIDFFNSIGLPFIEEKKGRLYPASLQARTVIKLLEYELKKRNVTIKLHRRVDKIFREKNQFKLITAGKEEYIFNSVILSAGSCACSQVAASRIGYKLAEIMNHTVYDPFPAILPINIPLKIIHRLQGIKWNCAAKVLSNGEVIDSSAGEILFTGFGISGPVSLDISRAVNEDVIHNRIPEIAIDFFPEYSHKYLANLLDSLWIDDSKSVTFSLGGIMKEKMPDVILEIAGIDPKKEVRNLSGEEKRLLVKTLKALTLLPGKPRNFNDAVIAAGGVDVNEIDPSSMESKLIDNLFITGELLDIDGDSGGYNLQFAWSSGAIAGMSQN